jgi:hypothetical protein
MAKFKFLPTVDVSGYFSAKLKGALTDADVGKPFKLSVDTTDTYELCADGDGIDAFLVSLEAATADGLKFGTLNKGDRVRCEASGSMTIGDYVEAGAVAAAGTAETNGLPLVSTHAMDSTTAITLLADMLKVNWRVISGTTANGTVTSGDLTVIIERL